MKKFIYRGPDILLASPSAYAVAYDVADALRNDTEIDLRIPGDWHLAGLLFKYWKPELYRAILAVPPEQHPLIVSKAIRLIEDYKRERRRERWFGLWHKFWPSLAALGVMALYFGACALAQWLGTLFFGNP